MNELKQQVGVRIRELREAKGLSQEALAALCNVHRTYVGLIERGKRSLSLETAESIAARLEVPVSAIFQNLRQSAAKPQDPKRVLKRPNPTLESLAKEVLALRQILIDAKITDKRRYEEALRKVGP